jgi:hypothetical protein
MVCLEGDNLNYWERKRSFWVTPVGILIETIAILAIVAGAILALNLFSSPFPVIERFDATPNFISFGEVSMLSWSVVGATSVRIDPEIGVVELEGNRDISPYQTTIYTLSAVNGTRNVSRSIRVVVE